MIETILTQRTGRAADVRYCVPTVRGDKASPLWFCVIGQITSRLGLAASYPLDEEPDGRLEGLPGNLDAVSVRVRPFRAAFGMAHCDHA